MTTPSDHTRYEILLVKAVDGVLVPDERAELDDHLESCEACRDELRDFNQIKEATDAMTERILRDASIESPRESGGTRATMAVGFGLIFAGLLTLMGFGIYELFTDPTTPPIIKIGTAVAGVGILILLAVVLRARFRGLNRDPYREIDL